MVPGSITRLTDVLPNAKLREMQQNTHGLMQLIRAATPDVPNQTPMPQLPKQMLNAPCTSLYECCRAVKVPLFLPLKVKAWAGRDLL